MKKILSRLKEPSTYAGIAAIIAGVGQVSGTQTDQVAQTAAAIGERVLHQDWLGVGMILAGALGVFLPERGQKDGYR